MKGAGFGGVTFTENRYPLTDSLSPPKASSGERNSSEWRFGCSRPTEDLHPLYFSIVVNEILVRQLDRHVSNYKEVTL